VRELAFELKGILSWGRSSMASNFGKVYKKINSWIMRHQVGTVVIKKQAYPHEGEG
jgi:hypothetical protein